MDEPRRLPFRLGARYESRVRLSPRGLPVGVARTALGRPWPTHPGAATAVAVAAARTLDARRADQLSAARRAGRRRSQYTELQRTALPLVAGPQLERRRRGMQKTQKWHSQVWCECHFCVGFFTAAAAQPAEWPQRHGACRLPRKACQRRWSCARVGAEVSKAAGVMPEHSPVPPEACRGARVADQRRTVPTWRRGAKNSFSGFVNVSNRAGRAAGLIR